MACSWHIQTADLNGIPSRIVLREHYPTELGALIPLSQHFVLDLNSAISPPLSQFELADIEASEREFSTDGVRTYDSVEDLVNALHASRSRFQRENR